MKTASAGTVESMDCIVTASEADPGSGVVVQLAGASVARFGSAMRAAVLAVASRLGVSDVVISVQGNGALDLVLQARTEAALERLKGVSAA